MRTLPNLITLLRLLCSPLLARLLLQSRFRSALAVVLFAGATDWLDGFLARRLKLSGDLGVILDPAADKALLVTLFLVFGELNLIPFWMLCLVIGRDLVIVTGALLIRLLRGIRKFLPTLSGKISTLFQIVLALLVLAYAAWPGLVLLWLKNIGLVCSAFFTALSGFDYVRRGLEMARQPENISRS